MIKIISFIVIVICMCLLGWAFYTGIPVNEELNVSGCSASYTRYLVPRELCQIVSQGHCSTTGINKTNAENEIGACLCNQYANNNSPSIAYEIEKLCTNPTHKCDSPQIDKTNYAASICENQSTVFYQILID